MDNFNLNILPLLIDGTYTDWFINVFLGKVFMILRNNIELLLLFAVTFQKMTKWTKTTKDDKAANWIMQFLSKFKTPLKGEEKNEKTD